MLEEIDKKAPPVPPVYEKNVIYLWCTIVAERVLDCVRYLVSFGIEISMFSYGCAA